MEVEGGRKEGREGGRESERHILTRERTTNCKKAK
jgi:hypothetical protein